MPQTFIDLTLEESHEILTNSLSKSDQPANEDNWLAQPLFDEVVESVTSTTSCTVSNL